MPIETQTGSCMAAFLEQEQAAAVQRMRKRRKRSAIWMIAVVPLCLLGTFLLGYYLSKDIALGIAHMKYGVYMAVFFNLIIILGSFCQNSAKKYMKSLQKAIAEHLPDSGTQEDFAAQMLDTAPSDAIRHIRYSYDFLEESVSVTRDYAIMRYGIEVCKIVRLKDVERIELSIRYFGTRISTNSSTTIINSKLYPIFFFYHNMGEIPQNSDPDVFFMLQQRYQRDQLIDAIKELTHS
ncbi:MAG TPA: hypothetical protein VN626_03475 [Clostridia bacterium]|nr:hypothetical protein [Clostridia bacterium]